MTIAGRERLLRACHKYLDAVEESHADAVVNEAVEAIEAALRAGQPSAESVEDLYDEESKIGE